MLLLESTSICPAKKKLRKFYLFPSAVFQLIAFIKSVFTVTVFSLLLGS